ncbi:MAG: M50 family metallopeptidase [Alphaproteobacteria bacterium]
MISQGSLLTSINMLAPEYLTFFAMLFGAFLIGLTPLRLPLQWLEPFYHELSHALAAVLTWGRVGRIKLNFDGSGWCTTGGGSRLIILLAGYTGAAFWGGGLYILGWLSQHYGAGGNAMPLIYFQLGVLAVAVVLWVRDPLTLIILGFAGALYGLPAYYPALHEYSGFIVQFIGLYVLLNAIRAPLHLLDARHMGDGAMLFDMTFIPEFVWVFLWFAFACAILLGIAILTLPGANVILWWLT